MALPFNPFDKPKKYTKARVFDKGDFEKPSENHTSINHNETIHQPIITKPSENQSSIIHQPIINVIKTFKQPIEKVIINQSSINHNESINKKKLDLVGKEQLLVSFLVDECSRIGSLTTPKISTDYLKLKTGLNANGVANLIFRIKEKNVFSIPYQKLGRVSYRIFSFDNETYIYLKEYFDHQETISKPIEKPSNLVLSSSNVLGLNKNTNTEEPNFRISDSLQKMGVGQRQLRSILNLANLSFDEIQSSIDHFDFDVAKNKRLHINILFGVMRKGSVFVSQTYSEILEREISKEIDRIQKTQDLEKDQLKTEMYLKYQEFKNNNPSWVEKIKAEQTFKVSDQIFDTIAFQKYCENEKA